jgi:hypothetical protein
VTSVHPTEVVDRELEASRFESLLRFDSPRRVFAVSDESGRGKSTFLRKLQHLCEYQHNVPVALVPLEEFDDRPDEFTLVNDIADQLSRAGLSFPTYKKLASAYSFRDVGTFQATYRSVYGGVDARAASVSGGQVAGTIINVEHAETVAPAPWDDEANRMAMELCVGAFFADLVAVAVERPVVIIFDTIDRATEQLQRWVFLQLVRRQALAGTEDDRKLVVVLAGTRIEVRLRSVFENLFDTRFESISALGDWDLADTKRLFEVHGYAGLSESRVAQLHQDLGDRALSIAAALSVAAIYASE